MFWEWIVIGATKRPASLFADRTDDLLSGTPSKRYPFRLVMFEVYPVPSLPSWLCQPDALLESIRGGLQGKLFEQL